MRLAPFDSIRSQPLDRQDAEATSRRRHHARGKSRPITAGFGLKEESRRAAARAGHDVVDFGADKLSPDDDYPDFVIPLAQAVAAGTIDRGVASAAAVSAPRSGANKIPGVRAGLIHDHFSATQGVEDDHMNRGSASVVARWGRP